RRLRPPGPRRKLPPPSNPLRATLRTLRTRLLRLHAGWVHLFNPGPSPDELAAGAPAVSLDPIGGQAVIEGVLMRSPGRLSIAARAPDGTIALRSRDFVPFAKRHKALGYPVLRGAASLVEALYVGTQALNWSAGVQEKKGGHDDEFAPPSSLGQKALAVLALAGSFALALGLFQLLPYAVASLVAGGTRDNPGNP